MEGGRDRGREGQREEGGREGTILPASSEGRPFVKYSGAIFCTYEMKNKVHSYTREATVRTHGETISVQCSSPLERRK